MIKFFRKIRQNLLVENKTGKYFKYAIGEILLVVIGILIALQINNWNENRKNNNIEQSTLISLKSDLESALVQLNNKIGQNRDYKQMDSILLDVIHFKKDISEDSLVGLTLSHIFSPGFDPELGTLNEILSTGKMEIIQNRNLRKHISTWNKYMDELEEVDEKLAHFDLQVKDPLYSKQLPYRNSISAYLNYNLKTNYEFPKSNFEWNSKALLQNKEFENMLSNYIIYSTIQYGRLSDIKQNINEMITLINQDINN
ncbi:DUF6090 family protein [Algibacter mikhailovii]|uniref:Uncharacterized protein n=1 Tax=Algibacter mikhailovii TaxID=425498 RepID=A0A918RE10_9FLAO|nr:DUF6090 family protein [Algibacter mikhailovii]GGZ95388.1 hypothetical protein GCM10007028_36640 [Algibacter mikhailovii]